MANEKVVKRQLHKVVKNAKHFLDTQDSEFLITTFQNLGWLLKVWPDPKGNLQIEVKGLKNSRKSWEKWIRNQEIPGIQNVLATPQT